MPIFTHLWPRHHDIDLQWRCLILFFSCLYLCNLFSPRSLMLFLIMLVLVGPLTSGLVVQVGFFLSLPSLHMTDDLNV